jgi:hypothetical protein
MAISRTPASAKTFTCSTAGLFYNYLLNDFAGNTKYPGRPRSFAKTANKKIIICSYRFKNGKQPF